MDSAPRAAIGSGPDTIGSDTIGPDTIVSLAPDVVTCALGEGAALLDLRSSSYFSLNPVASFVWETLAEPRSIATLTDAVRDSFAVQDADLAADMIAIVEAFAAADLVALSNAPPAAPGQAPPHASAG